MTTVIGLRRGASSNSKVELAINAIRRLFEKSFRANPRKATIRGGICTEIQPSIQAKKKGIVAYIG
jgi:hypothetical protein